MADHRYNNNPTPESPIVRLTTGPDGEPEWVRDFGDDQMEPVLSGAKE